MSADVLTLTPKQIRWRKYYAANREKNIARVSEWQKANPEKLQANRKRTYLKHKDERLAYQKEYTENNWDSIRGKQSVRARQDRKRRLAYARELRGYPEPTRTCPDVCECCGKPPGKRALALDHCHTTGKFRGWLCNKCNPGLGLLGDNKDGLLKALEYLSKSEVS